MLPYILIGLALLFVAAYFLTKKNAPDAPKEVKPKVEVEPIKI